MINNELAVVKNYMESIKDIDKLSEFPLMDKNPFMMGVGDKFTLKRKVLHTDRIMGNIDIVNQTTGEIISSAEQNTVFSKKAEVDRDRFVKIYFDRLKEMFDLSSTTLKVFGYFLREIQKPENKDKDLIYFDIKDCVDFCGYNGTRMVYKGLIELMQNGFIAKAHKPPSHYYIDPKTAFNGNRIIIWEEYVKKEDNYFDDKSLVE